MREESVVPYTPKLPLPCEAIINYNQSLTRITSIHAWPSGLEPTRLVLVHGLDIFYTRVAPSKTFDLLKEQWLFFNNLKNIWFDKGWFWLFFNNHCPNSFDSYFIISKQFASRKALKQVKPF